MGVQIQSWSSFSDNRSLPGQMSPIDQVKRRVALIVRAKKHIFVTEWSALGIRVSQFITSFRAGTRQKHAKVELHDSGLFTLLLGSSLAS